MKRSLVCLLAAALCCSFTGCATIINDLSGGSSGTSNGNYPVTLNSEPGEAQYCIKDTEGKVVCEGKTPATVKLNARKAYFKGKDYVVTFKKDGYDDLAYPIKRTLNGWYLGGNLLIGGLIGYLIVDPATGAMWRLEKNVKVTLKQKELLKSEADSITILTLESVPMELRSRMIRLTVR